MRGSTATRIAHRRTTVCLVGAALVAAGCGGSSGGPPTLNWYINPDNGGQTQIAANCTKAAHGQYKVKTSLLPSNASDQREQLIRRLAAKDSSIDLMSLDPVFVSEFAGAHFLAPIPRSLAPALTKGVVGPAVQGATFRGRLVTVPFWANTQILWYRKSVAQKAGLNLQAGPVTWAQLIAAAKRTGTTVAVQAKRYEGYVVLVNALIASAGGRIVKNPGAAPGNTRLGINSPAGLAAAAIVRGIAHSGVGGPALSTQDEEAARSLFQGATGGFMVNWPYVWQAAQTAVQSKQLSKSVLDDIGWTFYPRDVASKPARPPLGGIDLGIGANSKHPGLALDAARCISSQQNETYYFLNDGNPAARAAVFDAPAIRKAFPMAPLLRQSLQASAPRPRSQFYGDISAAIQREWHPPNRVSRVTPANSQQFIYKVLEGKALV